MHYSDLRIVARENAPLLPLRKVGAAHIGALVKVEGFFLT